MQRRRAPRGTLWSELHLGRRSSGARGGLSRQPAAVLGGPAKARGFVPSFSNAGLSERQPWSCSPWTLTRTFGKGAAHDCGAHREFGFWNGVGRRGRCLAQRPRAPGRLSCKPGVPRVQHERRCRGRNPRGRLRGVCFQGDKSGDVRSAASAALA